MRWTMRRLLNVALVLALLNVTVYAQRVSEDESSVQDDKTETSEAGAPTSNMEPLPKPLDRVQGNLGDIEAEGFFKLSHGRFGMAGQLQEPALIWMLTVTKPITCRHAMLLLDHLSDVRFYRTVEGQRRLQVFSDELYYPSRLERGAVDGKVLERDEQLTVWIPMTVQQAEQIRFDDGDILVFARLTRR